ncbi:MAG: oligosaccharide flippase family protein [Candidatus Omnitrophica bacterium]|nr:oligosaccharide flippase family protein [Candidatus Omnitrophota bacterium]
MNVRSHKVHKKDFFGQAIHSILTKGGLLFLGLISSVIMTRVLKPEGRGVIEMFMVYPFIVLAFGELGVRQATAFFIGQKTYEKNDITSSVMALFLISAPIVIGIIFLGYLHSNLFRYGLFIPLCFGLMTLAALFQRYGNGIFLGEKEVQKINYVQVINKIAQVLGVVIFVWVGGGGVRGAAMAYLLAQLLPIIIVLYWLIPTCDLKPRWVSPIPQALIKKGLIYCGSLLVIMLNYRIDIIMLGHMRTAQSVGLYAVGVNICELLKQIPLSIGVVLFSHATTWKADAVDVSLKKIAMATRVLLFLSVIGAIILVFVAGWLIPLLYGIGFLGSVQVIYFLVPGIIILNAFVALNLFMSGQGKPEIVIYSFIPALLLNIILNVFLIKRYDYIGAAVASTLSYSLGLAIYLGILKAYYKVRIMDFIVFKRADLSFIYSKLKFPKRG